MISLIQRVTRASVTVQGRTVGRIDRGVLALVGVEATDTFSSAGRMVDRLLSYRIFPDDAGKMNLDVRQIGGGLLLVPQFTLVADTAKGTRPSFSSGAPPAQALQLFEELANAAGRVHPHVAKGVFGADMQVELINDGPVTFLLRST